MTIIPKVTRMNKRTILYNSVPAEVEAIAFEATEPWTVVTCADGTVVKAKIVVKEVVRFVDKVNNDGEPLYHVPMAIVNHTIPGDGLTVDTKTKGMVN